MSSLQYRSLLWCQCQKHPKKHPTASAFIKRTIGAFPGEQCSRHTRASVPVVDDRRVSVAVACNPSTRRTTRKRAGCGRASAFFRLRDRLATRDTAQSGPVKTLFSEVKRGPSKRAGCASSRSCFSAWWHRVGKVRNCTASTSIGTTVGGE